MSELPFKLPNDPSRPVLLALNRVLAENWNAFIATCLSAAQAAAEKTVEQADVARMLDKALQSLKNVTEIAGWINPSASAKSFEEGMQIARRITDAGLPTEWAQNVVKRIGRKKAGRPATKRQIAIRAKEMRLRDAKRWKWSKLTAELCNCGKDVNDHDIRCQDNLRREVLHLEKTLRKFGCSVS